MITINDISTKSQLELIQLLVDDLKKEDLRQIASLSSLIKTTLLGPQKTKVEEIINELAQYAKDGIAANNPYAIFISGYINMYWFCCPIDFTKAIELYEQAIALGFTTAMVNRALMHCNGQGGPIDFAKAIELLDQAIALGNADAMVNRALMHCNGQGGLIDFAKAIELYDQAIALGNAGAMDNRAVMHYHGQGGPIDFSKAIELYERAIALGNDFAMNNRAVMHKNGQGSPIDFDKAIALWDQAIALGNTTAIYNRAGMHYHGQGGPVDFAKVIELYEQAIALGNANAMFNRAVMHYKGQGGPIDMVKAARLCRRAAEKNHFIALYNLGALKIEAFNYHYAMHQNAQANFTKAVDLMIKNPDLVTEFVEYDCQYRVTKNPNNLKHVQTVIEEYTKKNLDKRRQNELYGLVIIALEQCEKELFGNDISELMQLKKNYLAKINAADVKDETLVQIMQIAINSWYDATNTGWSPDAITFTQETSRFLSEAMYKLKLSDVFPDMLQNIALILVKNMYGENFDISINTVSVEQVMLLVALNDCPQKISIEQVHELFCDVGLVDEIAQSPEVTAIEATSPLTNSSFSLFTEQKVDQTPFLNVRNQATSL